MQLTDIGRKIFLDRYAVKDVNRVTLAKGDTVLALTEAHGSTRMIGKIVALDDGTVTVQLEDGVVTTVPRERIDKPLETDITQLWDRLARGAASVEQDTAHWQAQFRELVDRFKFVPGGRIMTMLGTDQNLTAFNCFVLPPPHDSRGGIMETLNNMTEIMSRGGGVGINISSLRPRHAYVKGVNGRSSGAVSWGGLYSYTTGLVEQSGSRRGALMLCLADWHPDVLEFINSKREAGNITNANISVLFSDEFMDAVKDDDDWQLQFPDTTHEAYDNEWDGNLRAWQGKGYPIITYQTVNARDLWNAVIESAWASAEPGILFHDRANKLSNAWYYSDLVGVNPCAEQYLPGWGVCNLGAVNLSQFYDADHHDVAWNDLRKAVRDAVRFLDNVIDITPYFFEENESVQKGERRIGLGTMGIAELLIKLEVAYGSDDSVALVEKIMRFIAIHAYEASANLAAEKGSFPQFDRDKYLSGAFIQKLPAHIQETIATLGMRNVNLLTQAPTGSTGTLANTSTGIEPFFAFEWQRTSRIGTMTERAAIVEQWREQNPDVDELPDYFVTAMDLSPEQHVKVQAAFQKWTDNAISKTCNVPSDYTVQQVGELYRYMYELGCKGGTVYRDGSRDEQVLNIMALDPDEAESAGYPTHICDNCNTQMVAAEGCFVCVSCGNELCTV